MKTWNFICGWLKTNHLTCEIRNIRSLHRIDLKLGKTLVVACISGLLSNTHAAENEQTEAQSAAIPDLEFLEFLGQFETDAGEWMDPDSLLTEEFTELLDVSTNAGLDQENNLDSDDNANDEEILNIN